MRASSPIVAILVLSAACARSEDAAPPPEAAGEPDETPAVVQEETSLMVDLAETAWTLDDLAGVAVIDGTQVTMEFNDQGQVSGSAGCNRYTGTYERSGDLLSFGPVAATRMACAPPILDQEMAFLGLLESEVRYEWTVDDRLILHPPDGGTPSRLSLLIGG